MKLKYWTPLVVHTALTLAIGYGLVIPRSCIAGINGLSMGFIATVATTAMAYAVGLAMVLREPRQGQGRGTRARHTYGDQPRPAVRNLIPMSVFAAANLGIGFGIIIPGTCIAGVNEITFGFVMAVLTGALTCWIGMLHVLQHERREQEREFAKHVPNFKPSILRPVHFLPVAGFVLLTLGLGFGLVIPGSCIAGANDMTIGFVLAIATAGLTCWAGMESATRDLNRRRMKAWATLSAEPKAHVMRLGYWKPMIAYQLFNVAIGFGLTIPGSCIAGANRWTLGFAAALLLAAFVYWIGLSMVLRAARAGWRSDSAGWLSELVARQAGHPSSGLLGRVCFWVMQWETGRENREAIRLLDLRPSDRVLEIGFGHGRNLRLLLDRVRLGFVAGVDISQAMVRRARRNLRHHLKLNRLALFEGTSSNLPCPAAAFDKAMAVHVAYFWRDPASELAGIRRVLRPAGRLVLVFRDKEDALAAGRYPSSVYSFRSNEEWDGLAHDAGFSKVELQTLSLSGRKLVCLLADT